MDEADDAPVIDGQNFLASSNAAVPANPDVFAAIAEACRSHGFFQIINSGVDKAVLHSMTRAMHRFFDLPIEEKNKVKRSMDNAMGFANDELTKQALDLKEIFDFCYVPHPDLPPDHPLNRTIDGTNRWPEGQPWLKEALGAYFKEMTRCAFKLTETFCIALGLEPNALEAHFREGVGFARLNFYEIQRRGGGPNEVAANQSRSEPLLGIHHHTDAGFLTILIQDEVAGLQMLSKSGEWRTVKPIPGALTINVGDMCQVLSNDEFKAPVHRVIAPTDHRRYSAAFFFNPAPSVDIAPLSCFVDKDRPAQYRPINWGKFREARFAGDYADLGEELQISHYKIAAPSDLINK